MVIGDTCINQYNKGKNIISLLDLLPFSVESINDMMVTFYRKNKNGETLFYTIHDWQKNMFEEYMLTTTWGKHLDSGREKVYTFQTQEDRDNKIRKIIKNRFKKGDNVLYSYFRKNKEETTFKWLKKIYAS